MTVTRLIEAALKVVQAQGKRATTAAVRELRLAAKDATFATAEDLAVAREVHARDGWIEVDDGALTSESEGGKFIQAWVWIEAPDVCGACGEPYKLTGPASPSAADPAVCSDCYINGGGTDE